MSTAINRKAFLRTCGAYCLGSLGVNILLESCASSNYYAVNVFNNNQLVVKKSEFIYVKDKLEILRRFVLIKNEKIEFPICVYRLNEITYVALYLKCTHQGCEVQPHNDYLVCPCHGSEYSNLGKVLQPPADEDLKQFQVSVEGENLIIHT